MGQGRVILETIESAILKKNPLKDPHQRQLAIYLPPRYEVNRSYPVIFLLPGFASKNITLLNREPFSEAIDEKMDKLIAAGTIQPMIIIIPDCFTYYGGSQYRNSEAFGNYESYLIQEIVPYVKSKFKLSLSPTQWAIMGKSSGGYGALSLGLRYPEIFGIVACHSGDMGFEYCYLPDFPEAMLTLEKAGGIPAFMKKFYTSPKKSTAYFLTLNILAMAAAYSPNLQQAPYFFDLPFYLHTGEINQDIWQQWLRCDPIRLIDEHPSALQQLKIYLDCGRQDEYRLYAGSRILSAKLQGLGIDHCYEEFDDGHRHTHYRYERSLQFISEVSHAARE